MGLEMVSGLEVEGLTVVLLGEESEGLVVGQGNIASGMLFDWFCCDVWARYIVLY